MTTIIGWELGNSTGEGIPTSTWQGDGVLEEIFAHFTAEELTNSGLDVTLLMGVQIEPVQEGE